MAMFSAKVEIVARAFTEYPVPAASAATGRSSGRPKVLRKGMVLLRANCMKAEKQRIVHGKSKKFGGYHGFSYLYTLFGGN